MFICERMCVSWIWKLVTKFIKNNYFLLWWIFFETCVYLDTDLGLELALRLISYGGLIGIDNSLVDKCFKIFKILGLHAILHDASGCSWIQRKRVWIFFSNHKQVSWIGGWNSNFSVCENFENFLFSFFGLFASRASVIDMKPLFIENPFS